MHGDEVSISLGSNVLSGLKHTFDHSRPRTGGGVHTHGIASHLQDEDVERGNLSVRLRGEWSAHPRFCVYFRRTAMFKIFANADDSLLDKPEATLTVTVARTRGAPNEIAVRTHDGETVTCVASSQTDAMKWCARAAPRTFRPHPRLRPTHALRNSITACIYSRRLS